MISRQRIISLAAVLLLVGVGLSVASVFRVRSVPYRTPQTIVVNTVYLGADARTVAETVGSPVEQQVNGVEHMLSMSSQSDCDGNYRLQITFAAGTDLDMAQVLVQNRVSLALPVLPAAVQQEGILVRKISPEPLMLIGLTAPGDRYDDLCLGNFASTRVKDELSRVPGVGDVCLLGKRDYRVRVMLDPDKLAARQLTAIDVAAALAAQNMNVPGLPVSEPPLPQGQPSKLTITTLTRLVEVQQLEELILKNSSDGQIVRLRDVARVELGLDEASHSSATLNARRAVVLSIYSLPSANPSQVSRAVADKVAELQGRVPDGLELTTAFDFAPNLTDPRKPAFPEHLVVDLELAEGTSAERAAQVLGRAAEVVRQQPEVRDVLALSEHPFSFTRNRPCLIVNLISNTQQGLSLDEIADAMRGRLRNQIPDAMFRMSVPSLSNGFPLYGFPIEFNIEDRGQHEDDAIFERVGAVVDAMIQSGKFADVAVGTGQHRAEFLHFDVDRDKCAALGVKVDDVLKTAQTALSPLDAKRCNLIDGALHVNVRLANGTPEQNSELMKMELKNEHGEVIRLDVVMKVRKTTGPMVIERHNMYRSERITANLTAGVTLAEARAQCEKLAEHELDTRGFKLVWRTHPSR